MANVFLNGVDRDIETAIMLEQAIVHDIGKAVAYTDGNRIFVNTDDNLYDILPAYDHGMLKWILWHERYHKELRHHNRFFKYLSELKDEETLDKFHVTKDEVNIIMDILVHDSLAKLFPELVETALNNLAQMRNRNSLSYTFKTFTLEEMLEEYAKHKKGEDDKKEGEGSGEGEDSKEDKDGDDKSKSKGKGKTDKKDKGKDGDGKADDKKAHGEGGSDTPSEDDKKDRPEDGEPDIKEDEPAPEPEPEHDKTDWSKLENVDTKEFIREEEGDYIVERVNKLKRMKAKLGKLTETLNGLVTSVRHRTYSKPNPIKVGSGVVLKGSKPGRVALYLCFDASGSMGSEMETFKEIISKSIPQAMETPTEWFSGHNNSGEYKNPDGRSYDYYKGQFKNFMKVYASSGYDDDGDRTIELCYKAEQRGFTPIGVTDGGGQISWSKPMLQKLQKTILVGPNDRWLNKAKEINPRIQTLSI